MVIGGSLFHHRPVHKVTWVSRDGFTENQIDHICVSRKWRRSLLDVRNNRSADIAYDHHLLIGEIRLRIARIYRQEEKIGRRVNTRRLEDAANAFIATGENNLGELRNQRKQWITDDTWKKIEEAKTRGAKSAARQCYSALEKEVKHSCRQDKRAWADSLADEVILNRIQEKFDATLRRQQAGFRAGRSCADNIVTLRIILEQVNEFQESLYLVFIDYEKAFGRLNYENMWGALRRKGVPEKIIGPIEAQYEAFSYRILHDGVLSDPIRVVAGVRQGCILSPLPLLFLIVIDEILVGAIDPAGLKINVNKTKSLDINTVNPSSFTVAGQAVENVESFQYLGSQMASNEGTKIDIGARIKKARAAFASLRNIWKKQSE
ncbi:uncharacterized protein LOC131676078 [Topomyia yanbarensis]|uniref:uncharacterized protein LOC131676078 n=1 Tax=Topomyia yanbarensis TaxID=2498891 RepID=UPI00273CBF67|nr:uncharacterized protein LOC131676078 [Topomyia yanbarensis]